jgi:hypothetical protein
MARFYVMDRRERGWVKVSAEYPTVDEAQKALEQLRRQFPFARVGGERPA